MFEPAAATIAAFAIVNSLIKTHELLERYIKELSSKRNRVNKYDYELYLRQLEMASTRIETWNEVWKIKDNTTEIWFHALWGGDGQDRIDMLLTRIKRRSQRIFEMVNIMGSKKSKRWTLKIDYTWRLDSELHSEISTLVDEADQLADTSETYFLLIHKASPDPIKPTERTSNELKNIMKTRTHSQQLFRLCYASSPLVVFLHIDLASFLMSEGTSTRPHSEPQYHILARSCPETTCWTEFKVEGLEEDRMKDVSLKAEKGIPILRSIREELGCARTIDGGLKETVSTIFGVRDSKTEETTYFKACTLPTNLELVSPPESFEKIRSSFQNMRFEDPRRPTLTTRYNLAFQLVRCALYLLGTSWLSTVGGLNLMKATTAGRRDLYLLPVPSPDTNEVNPDAEARSVLELQIFHIGVLLMEIGLERPLPPVKGDGVLEDMIPLLVMTRKLKTSMGSDYAEAARFCLEQRFKTCEGTASADFTNTLADFYQNVYSP